MLAAKQAQALEDKQTASLASNPRTHTNPPCPQTPSKTRAQKLWPDAESPPAPLTKTAFQGGVETQPRRHRQMNPLARHKASELARSAFVVSMNITAELESRGHQLAPATERLASPKNIRGPRNWACSTPLHLQSLAAHEQRR